MKLPFISWGQVLGPSLGAEFGEVAAMLTGGMTRPVPRAGKSSTSSDGAEPSAGHSNRLRLPEPLAGFAHVNRRSRRMRGRVPRVAQMPWLSAGGLRQGVQGAKRFGMVHGGFILKPDFGRPAGKLPRDRAARQFSEVF
jgi:hypothetical protein